MKDYYNLFNNIQSNMLYNVLKDILDFVFINDELQINREWCFKLVIFAFIILGHNTTFKNYVELERTVIIQEDQQIFLFFINKLTIVSIYNEKIKYF